MCRERTDEQLAKQSLGLRKKRSAQEREREKGKRRSTNRKAKETKTADLAEVQNGSIASALAFACFLFSVFPCQVLLSRAHGYGEFVQKRRQRNTQEAVLSVQGAPQAEDLLSDLVHSP